MPCRWRLRIHPKSVARTATTMQAPKTEPQIITGRRDATSCFLEGWTARGLGATVSDDEDADAGADVAGTKPPEPV